MPAGIDVVLDGNGSATIDFVDKGLRGAGLRALLDAADSPGQVVPLTRQPLSPRTVYRVPESVAAAAGLIDGGAAEPPSLKPKPATQERRVGEHWTRAELDEYAAEKYGIDTTGLADKAAVVAVLTDAASRPAG